MASPTTTSAPVADRREAMERPSRTVAPRVDIYETQDAFVLLADMPGVVPDGLDVIAERESLIVRGRVNPFAVTPEYSEFDLADYHREFRLTDDLDTDNVSATLHDGVLRVEIRKSERVQPRKIPVRTE